MKISDDVMSGILKSLHWIIIRNEDIIFDKSNNEKKYLDYIEAQEFKFFRGRRYSYIIRMCNKTYNIDAFTTLETANFIIDNIGKIEYAYNIDKMCDTVFGDLSDLFHIYSSCGSRYMKYLESLGRVPTSDDIMLFFKNGGGYKWSYL